MNIHELAIIPPIAALVLSLLTRSVVIALIAGNLIAAILAANFGITDGLLLFTHRLFETTQIAQCCTWSGFLTSTNVLICLYVIAIGVMMSLMELSGGARVFENNMKNYIRNKRQAEIATAFVAHAVAIDGYICTLTVSSVMRPIIDRFHSSRIMLAYIARSLAVPLCSLNPLSTWIAPLLLQLTISGISETKQQGVVIIAEPFAVYFELLPFIFYSILTVAMVWIVIYRQSLFGWMARYAIGKTNTIEDNNEIEMKTSHSSVIDFFFPIITMISLTLLFILLSGGYWVFGGSHDFEEAIGLGKLLPSVLAGSSLAIILYCFHLIQKKITSWKRIFPATWNGIKAMALPIFILNLAWTFGSLETKDHSIGNAIHSFFPGQMPIALFPLIFFLLSALVSLAIGSSWATIAILFPLTPATLISILNLQAPVPIESLPVLIPCLGAIVSGAVCGDHLSPISDLAIVASAGTKCPYIQHVQSQCSFAMPVVAFTMIAYFISGFLIPYGYLISVLFPLFCSVIAAWCYLSVRESMYRQQQKYQIKM